jgi:hypothetical protein
MNEQLKAGRLGTGLAWGAGLDGVPAQPGIPLYEYGFRGDSVWAPMKPLLAGLTTVRHS